MRHEDRSILQQKAHATYNRNQQIRQLYKVEKNMASIGRMFKLPRQAIRKIISEEG